MSNYERVMHSLHWIPNAVSYFRGLLVAPLVAVVYFWEFFAKISNVEIRPEILGNYPRWMCWLVVAAAASDWLDGFLAKTFEHYGWRTEKGADTDAYCDKFLGIAVLYVAIPVHYWLGWYLVLYAPALYYIAYYSQKTTRMRQDGLIKKPNRIAQWKTAILMGVKVAAFVDMAYLGNGAIVWVCTVATAFAAVLCIHAMEDYKNSAAIAAASVQQT